MSGKKKKNSNSSNYDNKKDNEDNLAQLLEQFNITNNENEKVNDDKEISNKKEEKLNENQENISENLKILEENENKTTEKNENKDNDEIIKNEKIKEKTNSISKEEKSSKNINSLMNILNDFEIVNENNENKSIDEISFIRELYKNINYKVIMKAIDDELEITIKNINIKPFPDYYSKFKLNELQIINYFKLFNSINELLYEIKNLLQNSSIKIIETNQILFTIPINMRIINKIQFNIKEIEKTLEEKNSLMEKYILYLEEKIINFEIDLENNKKKKKKKLF